MNIAESRGHDNEDNVQDRSESKRENTHVCSLGGNQVQPARTRGTKVKCHLDSTPHLVSYFGKNATFMLNFNSYNCANFRLHSSLQFCNCMNFKCIVLFHFSCIYHCPPLNSRLIFVLRCR